MGVRQWRSTGGSAPAPILLLVLLGVTRHLCATVPPPQDSISTEASQEHLYEHIRTAVSLRALAATLLDVLQSQEGMQEETLSRHTRGYFPNIDLGLQDNEILPPLKGYKLYNQQLARVGKKQRWGRPPYGDNNFMREEVDEEEAAARAEQEEVRRQAAEAQRARAEQERLADIASDRVLQYMVKKQGDAYAAQRRKNALATNAVEDKRSEEEDDEEDIDSQTIDKLIEISSKLHLPADDVVEIISDVEEKKKKRKDMPQSMPRFRPLVPPAPPYGTWLQSRAQAKMRRKHKLWNKPEKHLLAYPTFPYYQKPYRAFYPVYFPLPPGRPRQRFFTKQRLALNDLVTGGFQRRFRLSGRKRPTLAHGNYIPNYILPHPRTYQAQLYYPRPPSPQVEQQDSDEELEKLIQKVYWKRRLFQK